MYLGGNGSTEYTYSKGNKILPGKVATTRTEDQNKHYNVNQKTKKRRTTDKEWKDQFYFKDEETGNTPNPSKT
jgi:DNA recombination-dependent growth factor C